MLDREDLEPLLCNHRAVLVGGAIDEDLCHRIRPQILALALADDAPIRILIDSEGGDMDQGLLLYDLIRGLPVATTGIVFGKCLSMAVAVLQACTERAALPNASFMVHSARSCAHGIRTQSEFTKAFANLETAQKRVGDILCARTGLKPREFKALIREGDESGTQFYAERALKLNFIDRISLKLFPDPPA